MVANQEREKLGLENNQAHDTESAIKTAIEALRILIKMTKKASVALSTIIIVFYLTSQGSFLKPILVY